MNMVFVSSTIVIQFLSILLVFNGIPLEFLKNLLAKTSAVEHNSCRFYCPEKTY